MQKESAAPAILTKLLSRILLFLGILFLPFVFNRLLGNGRLVNYESLQLMVLASVLVLSGILLATHKVNIGVRFSLVLLGLSLVVFTEVLFRGVSKLSMADATWDSLELMSKQTHENQVLYVAHPFTQFTGRPSCEGCEGILADNGNFNNFGFRDEDRTLKKPADVFRIAALGGSTTERGYPAKLESALDDFHPMNKNVAVLNFGIAGWTSANSLSNYFLNVINFKPDMIVLHHGWNDFVVLGYGKDVFRNDYSHVLTNFTEPSHFDKWPLRFSLIYRYINMQLYGENWTSLNERRISQSVIGFNKANYDIEQHYQPYKRNISNIISHAVKNDIQVVLATMPSSSDTTMIQFQAKEHIAKYNQLTRKIKTKFGSRITLVDLDSLMSGKFDMRFVDIGHLDAKGEEIKAKFIAQAVKASIREQSSIE